MFVIVVVSKWLWLELFWSPVNVQQELLVLSHLVANMAMAHLLWSESFSRHLNLFPQAAEHQLNAINLAVGSM